jgi:hypothetical protein
MQNTEKLKKWYIQIFVYITHVKITRIGMLSFS